MCCPTATIGRMEKRAIRNLSMEISPPTDAEMAALERQLDALPESELPLCSRQGSTRTLVLKLLHIGNIAISMGASETRLRTVLKTQAPQVLGTPWSKLGPRLRTVLWLCGVENKVN